MMKNLSKLIFLIILVAGVSIAGTYFYLNKTKIPQKTLLSSQEAAQKAIDYINQHKDDLAGGSTASLVNVSDAGEIYKIRLKIGENEFESYITKDGKYLFPGGYDLEELKKETPAVQPEVPEGETPAADKLEALAKCLTEKGAKFYGAYWCGWCKKQKELFGESAQYLPYIECIDEETQQITSECQAAGITGFPTWEFGEEKNSGFKSLKELAQLSGCPF